MITPNTPLIARCPCCNKELNIEIVESGGGMTATLLYPQRVASREELEAHGYEFGEAKKKLIINSGVARKLIQIGNQVVDIKPLKEDPSRSAFVFVVTEKFSSDLASLSK